MCSLLYIKQFTMQYAVVKNGGDFATAVKTVCNALADSLIDTEKFIQSQLKKDQDNSEMKQ